MSTLPAGLTAGTWTIDASHSEIGFSVRHAMISKTRGRFGAVEGTVVAGESLESTVVSISIPVASLDTRDDNRDGHLKSGDFFDVETHPSITFVSTSVAPKGDDVEVTGDLTIRDVTKSITMVAEFNGTATDPFGNNRAGFTAETEIDRKEFGLTWNAALETGGVLVGDKVKIHLDVEFTAAQA